MHHANDSRRLSALLWIVSNFSLATVLFTVFASSQIAKHQTGSVGS